ncbi:MAG: hypothetical protein ABR999_00160 [Methanoregula sp.]|jgi:hypothetical protein|uniref:AbiTii domain-containing protein n=1 Tax=Methanoregula sp. TaxID=2052170 RepID=UPI003D0B588C
MSPTEEATILAKNILDDLEINDLPISKILMKTTRLARLMNDSEAQLWLMCLRTGYPDDFDPKLLRKYKKYYLKTWTITENVHNTTIVFTLPVLEFFINNHTWEKHFASILDDAEGTVAVMKLSHNLIRRYEEEKMLIHNYVTEVFLSLSIGEIVENIFQDSRATVDLFVQENCSTETKQKLLAIDERLKENSPESYSQALLSCRRILESIADSIFPAQEKQFTSSNGRQRDVNQNNYINRILAFIEQNSKHKTNSSLISSNLEHMAARLDALNNESQKGVHDEVTKEEARLTIIQMYLIIAEIARIKRNIPKS